MPLNEPQPEDQLQFNEADRSDEPAFRWVCVTPAHEQAAWLHGGPDEGEDYYAFGFDDPKRSVVVHVRLRKVHDFRDHHPGQGQRALMQQLLQRSRRKSSARQWFDAACRSRKATRAWQLDKLVPQPRWQWMPLALLPDGDMQRMEEVGSAKPFSPEPEPVWERQPVERGTCAATPPGPLEREPAGPREIQREPAPNQR